MTRTPLDSLLARRILVLDGAMGTMIQRLKLDGARLPRRAAGRPSQGAQGQQRPARADPARRASPAIHAQYLDAGADIIETNTFTEHVDRAGRLRPRAAGLRAQPGVGADCPPRRRRVDGAHARPAALRRRLARPDQQVAVDLAQGQRPGVPRRHLRRDARRLSRAGRAACSTAASTCCWSRPSSTRSPRRRRWSPSTRSSGGARHRLPLMISVTITDRSGRTLSGQTLDAFYVSIEHARPFSVGINCALGAREMRPYLAELARIADTLRELLPQRRAAQRLRRVRPAGRGNRGAAGASSPRAAS